MCKIYGRYVNCYRPLRNLGVSFQETNYKTCVFILSWNIIYLHPLSVQCGSIPTEGQRGMQGQMAYFTK